MSKFLLISMLVFCSSCAASGKVTKQRDFRLDPRTGISVQSENDQALGAMVEGELLGLGFEVVPFELVRNSRETESEMNMNTTGGYSRSASTTSSYAVRYVPSRIVISIVLSLDVYPTATYLANCSIRVIDLSDQKMLASFQYDGNGLTFYDRRVVVRRFIEDLKSSEIL